MVWILERWLDAVETLSLEHLYWIRQHGDGNPERAEKIAQLFGWLVPARQEPKTRPTERT